MSGPLHSSTENTFINKKHKRAARKLRSSKYLQYFFFFAICCVWLLYLMWNYPHACTGVHEDVKNRHAEITYMCEHKKKEKQTL